MGLPAQDSQLVQIVDAALADAARRAGPWLVCRLGCTQCCHGAFAINALDTLRLQEGLKTLRVTDPALAAEINRRAHAWIAEYSADFPGNPETGLLGQTETEQQQFEDFANDAPSATANFASMAQPRPRSPPARCPSRTSWKPASSTSLSPKAKQ